ncbi:IclR family transcriptional regulator [Tardiphaga sp. 709]|uniref:IclR family transcriptional regulator n=1 Tax=Tardiphaga sp. 709 TaxID=3076039 RepID=UPI0028E901E8|nr:IclR family transcriptional regulator [Tardiphaga sp. 709]WNV11797.1 IclR family transcriptional regulator [Tardiphaga sp. 709]
MDDDESDGIGKPESTEQRASGGVNSVEVGLSLLQPLLEAGTPLTLKAISSALGMPPPKAHRYLASLIAAKLVQREHSTPRYELGPLAVRLGFAALGMLDRDGLARRAMSRLAMETHTTACVVMWADKGAIVVAVEPGPGTIFTGLRIGSHLPLLHSATGRLFLAHLSSMQTASHLILEDCVPPEADPELAKALRDIRTSGVSGIRDGVMLGMSGLAAPVFNHEGGIHCSLTLVFQTYAVKSEKVVSMTRQLRSAAEDLSHQLGFVKRDMMADQAETKGSK